MIVHRFAKMWLLLERDVLLEGPKSEIVEQLWKILISDNSVDQYESNLMRRICGLIYFSDKDSGEIRMRLSKNK